MAEFDRYKDDYQAQIDQATTASGKRHEFFVRVKADYLTDILKAKVAGDDPIRLLDVGCGHGLIHPMLESSGLPLKITGIDVAGDVIGLARKANPRVRYDVYGGDTLPYRSAEFDAALAITVLHHVPPPQWASFLAEMRRVVRPGGIVTVFEHNPYNPFTTHIVRTCPLDEHAVLLPRSRLAGLMRGTGLHDVQSRFILFTPFGSSFFKAFDHAMGWLPLGAQYVVTGSVPARHGR